MMHQILSPRFVVLGTRLSRSLFLTGVLLLLSSSAAKALTVQVVACTDNSTGYRTGYSSYFSVFLSNLPGAPEGYCADPGTIACTWTIVSSEPGLYTGSWSKTEHNPTFGQTDGSCDVSHLFFENGELGYNSITLKCSVTYTPPCGTAVTADDQDTLYTFIIGPEKVVQTEPVTANGGSPWNDGGLLGVWGHSNTYHMEIQDNGDSNPLAPSSVSQPYSNGLPREEFQSATAPPNPPYGADTWFLDYCDGTGSPASDFTDNLTYTQYTATGYAASNVVNEFDQVWHCMELIPPTAPPRDLYVTPGAFHIANDTTPPTYTQNPGNGDFLSNVNDTQLNTDHIVNRMGGDVRTSYP